MRRVNGFKDINWWTCLVRFHVYLVEFDISYPRGVHVWVEVNLAKTVYAVLILISSLNMISAIVLYNFFVQLVLSNPLLTKCVTWAHGAYVGLDKLVLLVSCFICRRISAIFFCPDRFSNLVSVRFQI